MTEMNTIKKKAKKNEQKMNECRGGCSSIMGGAENKLKKEGGVHGPVCKRIWAGSTHELWVGSREGI